MSVELCDGVGRHIGDFPLDGIIVGRNNARSGKQEVLPDDGTMPVDYDV